MGRLNNEQKLKEVVKSSNYFSEVLEKMGYVHLGGAYKTLYKYIIKFNIDISHIKEFKRERHKFGKVGISLDKILNNEVVFKSSHDLKLKLYKSGLKQPICEMCGQDENWKTGKISMILDHIDGNRINNKIENLRIICPNCDATLPTFKGRNRK